MSTAPSTERKSITPTTNDTQTTQNNGSTSSTSVTVPSTTHAAAASTPSAPPLKRQESSARSAILRLVSDYNELLSEANDGCSASPVTEDNMFVWKAVVFGPADSPWEGGVFQLRMQFTKDYPQAPPTVQFVTRMFHPNIYKDGALCLDVIQDKWKPIYTVSTILTSIQSLLQDPNPNSPANPEAAKLWSTDRKAYNRMVRMCVDNC